MTGWRVGWLAGRKDLVTRASQLTEFVVSHAPSFSQRAGETALLWGEDMLRQMVCRLRENRDFCLGVLSKIPGVTIPVPDGAFYLFAKIDGVTDSFEFCKQLLMETKVGLAHGVGIGEVCERIVRICHPSDRAIHEKAKARLKLFLDSRR